MVAKNQDFEIVSGNSYTVAFTVKDTDGTATDLTFVDAIEWRASKLLSMDSFESTAVITKTMVAGQIIIDAPPTAGECHLVLTSAETEPLYGQYYHELQLTHPGNSRTTTTIGTMKVLKNLIVATPP